MAPTTNMLARQPTELDYADPTKFKFSIQKLPKVEFFTTAANLPGINLGESIFPTPIKQVPVMGDDLTFDNLEIEFIVDAQLENYRELHQWLVGIGVPKARTQFADLVQANKDRFPTEGRDSKATDAGKVKYGASPLGPIFSDATLNVLTSKNTANIPGLTTPVYS